MRAQAASVQLGAGAALARRRAAALVELLERERRAVLASVVAAQTAIALAVALTARHDGWLYYHGGDSTWYWSNTSALGHFRLPFAQIGFGLPVLWSPAGAVLGPSLLSGLPFVVLVNALVLLPLVPLLLYGVARRISGVWFGLATATAWVVVPLLGYRMFRPDYRQELLDIFYPGAIGLNAMGDFASLVACLAAAYFTLRAIDSAAPTDALVAGALAGFAIAIKPANALFVPAPVLGLLLARRWRQLLPLALGALPALVALVVWKQRGLGTLPLLASEGTIRLAAGSVAAIGLPNVSRYGSVVDWGHIQSNLQQLREIFWSRGLAEWVAVAGSFGLLRRSFAKGAVLVAWFWAYLLVKGSSEFATVYSTTFFRLLEPAYAPYVVMAAASVFLLVGRRPAEPVVSRPVGRRTAAVPVVVLGVLPLLLVATARPAGAGSYAQDLGGGVQVPVRDFGLTAVAHGDAVQLRWRPRHSSTASVAYRVYRTSDPQADCGDVAAGVPDCVVTSQGIANPPTASFVDRPGAGRWIYRVAMTAVYNAEPASGDPLLASEPATVTVPGP
jgi:hypothetical protein